MEFMGGKSCRKLIFISTKAVLWTHVCAAGEMPGLLRAAVEIISGERSSHPVHTVLRVGMPAAFSAVCLVAASTLVTWIKVSRRRAAAAEATKAAAERALFNASLFEISEEHLPSFAKSHGLPIGAGVEEKPLLRNLSSVPNILLRT